MQPYVFISYAHRNNQLVLPVIRQLQDQGIALWYDSGIEAGSEWPEFVAEKVMNCDKFVLFISNDYLQSQNCKRELNFAISRKKEILSIFLEEVTLTPGMEMQLGTYQAIFCKRFPSHSQFVQALPNEPFFNSCRAGAATIEEPTPVKAAPQEPTPTTWASMEMQDPTAKPRPAKSRVIAAVLVILLGNFGVHKFYLRKYLLGVLYAVFFWAYIPAILGVIEGIILLTQDDAKFAEKYKCIPK